MVKRITRKDEERDQEETQDCQRSIPSILDPRHPNNLQTLQKFKAPDLRDISVILTAPHRHSFSLDILSTFCQESKHCLLVIYCLTNVFQWKPFLLFVNNGFFLFFELLDNLATHITWSSEEDPVELCHSFPSWIFQTHRGHGRIWQSKYSEAKVVVTNATTTTSTVTSSHTTLGSVTSIGPHT